MDTCYAQLHVYDCPPAQRKALHAAVMAVFGEDADEEGDGDYCTEGMSNSYMTLDTLAPELAQVAPGASWSMWDEPEDETGHLRAYTPGRGHFDAPCDRGGTVVLTRHTLAGHLNAALADAPAAVAKAVHEAIEAATGQPWGV